MNPVSLKDLLQELAAQRNLDLRGYKATSLERRFRHRMFQLKIGDYSAYAEYIRDNPAEINYLLATVLINVTQFFRDPQAWDALRNDILPKLTSSLIPGDTFRCWSAGCATGEEAYSLAILLSEQFGDRIHDYDVKIYATDVDEDALNTARRGEYSSDKLRAVRAEWRRKYFVGEKVHRLNRELRRLVIFGRSNLVSDAPISHVKLLLCRNVLIYFDSELQKHVLTRLHYALDSGGVLMLGRSESQLSQSPAFTVVNPKWRLFRRAEATSAEESREAQFLRLPDDDHLARAKQDYSMLRTYHQTLLETLEPGVVVLDRRGVVINDNKAVSRLWNLNNEKLMGRRLASTGLAEKCPELISRLATLHKGQGASFECSTPAGDGESRQLAVTLRPVAGPRGEEGGVLVYMEDVTPRHRLQHTIEELENTGKELQSTNEELETTNEELQSTNEELETTNEELQSTNEELETTNEELQALNEELRTTNDELEIRTTQLDELNLRYSETLERMPWPLMLVTKEGTVRSWNSAAERLFGLPAASVMGLHLKHLPFPEALRNRLASAHRASFLHTNPTIVRGQELEMDAFHGKIDLQMTPLVERGRERIVLVTFRADPMVRKTANRRASAAAGGKKAKSKSSGKKLRTNGAREKQHK